MLTNEDCELLCQLNEHNSMTELARTMNLDKAFISRKLISISEKGPVLEKVLNKWRLTAKGIQVIQEYKIWTQRQAVILKDFKDIKIATTQTVSERILVPHMKRISDDLKVNEVHIITCSTSFEEDLLANQVDFVLSCQVPQGPEVRYKKVFKSPFYVFSTPKFLPRQLSNKELFEHRYILHPDLDLRKILGVDEYVARAFLKIDHSSGVRQAVLEGLGWSILPYYAIDREAEQKKLSIYEDINLKTEEQFYLWWVPKRFSNEKTERLISLMKSAH